MKTLPGSRERVDIGPVGGSIGAFIGAAMMSAAFARAPWPSFQRHLSPIKSTPGRHWAGMLQNSGTTIAMMSAALARAPWPSFQRHLSSIKRTPGVTGPESCKTLAPPSRMMGAAFAQAGWPSFQRLRAWITNPSGRHSAGIL